MTHCNLTWCGERLLTGMIECLRQARNKCAKYNMTRADQRKHHIIYKTTCLATGKWYIGMHSTNDLKDKYIGSGQRLWKSIKKHGKEAHVCEILEHLPDRRALSDREKVLVEEAKKDPMCMNLRQGGLGAYPGRPTSEETRERLRVARSKGPNKTRTDISYGAMSAKLREGSPWNRSFLVTTPNMSFTVASLWELEKHGMQLASARLLVSHGMPSRRGFFKGWSIKEH
jgi:hypothetical protein